MYLKILYFEVYVSKDIFKSENMVLNIYLADIFQNVYFKIYSKK